MVLRAQNQVPEEIAPLSGLSFIEHVVHSYAE